MSRKLLAFLLSELATVRLICRKPDCGRVVEMSVETFFATQAGDLFKCKFCGQDFNPLHGNTPSLRVFADGLAQIKQLCGEHPKHFDLEFVLPDDS